MTMYGVAEMARALGISRQAVANQLARGQTPEPDARLRMGPVWLAKTVEPWLRERGALIGVDAVFVHNNAYDTVLVANEQQAALMVDAAVFADFVAAATNDPCWSDWSHQSWAEHGDTLAAAAPAHGEIVAYYVGQQLTVVDQARWEERREFYLRHGN